MNGYDVQTIKKIITKFLFRYCLFQISMGGGQAGAYARFVLKAMAYFKSQRGTAG